MVEKNDRIQHRILTPKTHISYYSSIIFRRFSFRSEIVYFPTMSWMGIRLTLLKPGKTITKQYLQKIQEHVHFSCSFQLKPPPAKTVASNLV